MRNIMLRVAAAAAAILLLTGCEKKEETATVRVGSLKGPTTMGIVHLIHDAQAGETEGNYEFTMAAAADELTGALAAQQLDIALIPANAAAILYQKTDGGIRVIDINTLGVLYCLTGREDIKGIKDLSGKTVYTTGQGTTPEYALNYLLSEYGVSDCSLSFCSEATEAAAYLQKDPDLIAVLPQPFVTAALMQNENLNSVFSLSEEWDALENGSGLVTGVTVVRTEFLEEHPEEVRKFLEEQEKSVTEALQDTDETAQLIVEQGIMEKVPAAKKALPECNLVCISGDDMKEKLSGYLQTLFDQNPSAVGGAMPDEDFYAKLK